MNIRTLNLTCRERSGIDYVIKRFPDGQQDVQVNSFYRTDGGQPVTILSRFTSFQDLELILCASQALRRLGVKEIRLSIPYLLGARSDRQFNKGDTSYLVDVIAPILNSFRFESVTCLDVHSDVAMACIPNLINQYNSKFVKSILERINNTPEARQRTAFIAPDAGAVKKLYRTLDYVHYTDSPIICSKHRNTGTGALSDTIVPEVEGYMDRDLVIIDDICDGGRTFIELAKEARRVGYTGKIYLIVTHGIFSKGLAPLAEVLDGVFCTNSVRDIPASDVPEGFTFYQENIF